MSRKSFQRDKILSRRGDSSFIFGAGEGPRRPRWWSGNDVRKRIPAKKSGSLAFHGLLTASPGRAREFELIRRTPTHTQLVIATSASNRHTRLVTQLSYGGLVPSFVSEQQREQWELSMLVVVIIFRKYSISMYLKNYHMYLNGYEDYFLSSISR